MAAIKRFEDIKAWQTARELVNHVYAISRENEFAKDFGLRDQIRRAAGSCMHNIAEGFDGGSDKEFIRFLKYALRSATEVQSQLYTALDQSYVSDQEFKELYQQAKILKSQIWGFINYLKNSNQSNGIREDASEYIVSLEDIDD